MCGGIHHGIDLDTIPEKPDWPFMNDGIIVESLPGQELLGQNDLVDGIIEQIRAGLAIPAGLTGPQCVGTVTAKDMAVAKLIMRRHPH